MSLIHPRDLTNPHSWESLPHGYCNPSHFRVLLSQLEVLVGQANGLLVCIFAGSAYCIQCTPGASR